MEPDEKRMEHLINDSVQRFTKFVGLEPVKMEPGRFVTRVRIEEHHLQQDGYVHAGVVATMADHTAGYASYSLAEPGRRILTIEYKINFLKPAMGEYVECRAKVIKPGRRIIIAESEVYSIDGDSEYLAAKALLTMAAVPEKRLKK